MFVTTAMMHSMTQAEQRHSCWSEQIKRIVGGGGLTDFLVTGPIIDVNIPNYESSVSENPGYDSSAAADFNCIPDLQLHVVRT